MYCFTQRFRNKYQRLFTQIPKLKSVHDFSIIFGRNTKTHTRNTIGFFLNSTIKHKYRKSFIYLPILFAAYDIVNFNSKRFKLE